MVETLQHPMLRRFYIIAWMILITVTLLQSSGKPIVGAPAPPGPPSDSRELFLTSGHVVAFSVMLILLWWALRNAPHALFVSWIICCLFGGITELLQRLVPDRSASLGDFAVDCLFSAIAALLIYSRGRFSGVIHKFVPSLLRSIVPP
ncbi:MAG: VanZ family protein [Chloroflexota bacterium]